ncbi:hypothetical protein [Atopobacter phocae]|uniref:hypothetical protein n=1 Tax=Atopobacter phocae TaxID=136492 RepID=UPI00046FAD7B|nr:hypothetical protein [Atopobacter phocae]
MQPYHPQNLKKRRQALLTTIGHLLVVYSTFIRLHPTSLWQFILCYSLAVIAFIFTFIVPDRFIKTLLFILNFCVLLVTILGTYYFLI